MRAFATVRKFLHLRWRVGCRNRRPEHSDSYQMFADYHELQHREPHSGEGNANALHTDYGGNKGQPRRRR